MRDDQIIDLYWQRSETAIEETDQKYGRYLTAIAYNILSDLEDSKESVNDTYMNAWNSMPPHRPNVLSAYLAKITRNVSIDRIRRKNRGKRVPSEYLTSLSELSDCVTDGQNVEREIDMKQLGEALNAFVRALPDEARHLFIGRYFYMDPLREVARYCGMSEAKAKSMLHRLRLSLKAHLEKEGFGL